MTSKAAQLWFDTYIETGNAKEAVTLAFPNVETEVSRQSRASQLKRQFAEDIHKAITHKLTVDSPNMLNVISDLANNANGENIKLSAARDLLDRAGFSAKPDSDTVNIQVNIDRGV